MSRRALTILNCTIALVTLTAVGFDVYARREHRNTGVEKAATDVAPSKRAQTGRRAHGSTNKMSDLRVDKMDSVPPSEFYELFLEASPSDMMAIALKFNDLPLDVHTEGGVGMFFQAWAELDGKSALKGGFQLKDISLRRIATFAVVHSVSPAAAPELATYLRDHPDTDLIELCRNQYMDAVVERWAGISPGAAAKFLDALENPDRDLVSSAGTSIAYCWANLDPPSALAWIDQQNHAEDSGTFFSAAIRGWQKIDAAAAAEYVAGHADHAGAAEIAREVVSGMFGHDGPDRAVSWVNTLPAGETRIETEKVLADIWGQKDPVATGRWIEGLTTDDQKAAAYSLAATWGDQDWAGTRTWLNSLTGDVRNEAIAGAFMNSQSQIPPSEALPFALSISDRETQFNVVQRIVQHWAETDRAAAENWIRKSSLSPADKQHILSTDIISAEPSQ